MIDWRHIVHLLTTVHGFHIVPNGYICSVCSSRYVENHGNGTIVLHDYPATVRIDFVMGKIEPEIYVYAEGVVKLDPIVLETLEADENLEQLTQYLLDVLERTKQHKVLSRAERAQLQIEQLEAALPQDWTTLRPINDPSNHRLKGRTLECPLSKLDDVVSLKALSDILELTFAAGASSNPAFAVLHDMALEQGLCRPPSRVDDFDSVKR